MKESVYGTKARKYENKHENKEAMMTTRNSQFRQNNHRLLTVFSAGHCFIIGYFHKLEVVDYTFFRDEGGMQGYSTDNL